MYCRSFRCYLRVVSCQMMLWGLVVPCHDYISYHLHTPPNVFENLFSACPHVSLSLCVRVNGRDVLRETGDTIRSINRVLVLVPSCCHEPLCMFTLPKISSLNPELLSFLRGQGYIHTKLNMKLTMNFIIYIYIILTLGSKTACEQQKCTDSIYLVNYFKSTEWNSLIKQLTRYHGKMTILQDVFFICRMWFKLKIYNY